MNRTNRVIGARPAPTIVSAEQCGKICENGGSAKMVKHALITGASSGIGRAVAFRLAEDGWHILAHGRRREALDDTLTKVFEAGGSGDLFQAEMGDMQQVANLCDFAASHGPLDAVVHCAAKFTYGPVSTERFADWDLTIDQVLRATIRLTAHTLESVKKAEGAYVYLCGPTSWLGWKTTPSIVRSDMPRLDLPKRCLKMSGKTA